MNFLQLFIPFFQVVYVVLAVIMIALILMQRGAGAQAGSSFGAGASGTVFGAQGSANFLSRATAVCATLFFLISFGMGVYLSHRGKVQLAPPSIMDSFQTETPKPAANPMAVTPAPATGAPTVPAANSNPSPSVVVPAEVPAAPNAPAVNAEVPIVPTPVTPTVTTPAPAANGATTTPQPNAPAPQR